MSSLQDIDSAAGSSAYCVYQIAKQRIAGIIEFKAPNCWSIKAMQVSEFGLHSGKKSQLATILSHSTAPSACTLRKNRRR